MGAQEFSRRRRLLILAICCMSLFIAGLDSTIVNVALPSIQRDLHAPVSALQWTVDAYTLVLASFLILSGSTGDRVGRRRIFQTGLVLFTLGSLLCSLAPGLGWLIAFRVLQAIGGSMLNPVPAGCARLLRAARRTVHAADGGDDRGVRAAVRPHPRCPGTAAAASSGRPRDHDQRRHVDPAGHRHPGEPRSLRPAARSAPHSVSQ
jgi:hypothetical protein